MSFHIYVYNQIHLPVYNEIHLPASFIEQLALNKRFVNLNIHLVPSLNNECSSESRGQTVYLLGAILHNEYSSESRGQTVYLLGAILSVSVAMHSHY